MIPFAVVLQVLLHVVFYPWISAALEGQERVKEYDTERCHAQGRETDEQRKQP